MISEDQIWILGISFGKKGNYFPLLYQNIDFQFMNNLENQNVMIISETGYSFGI
jgi:hypothetical protein